MFHARTLVPVLQTYNHRGIVRASTRVHAVAARHGEALQFGNLLYFLLHLLHHLACLLQCGSFRSTNFNQEHALVLLRNEARGQTLHEEDKQGSSSSQQSPRQDGALDELLHALAILIIYSIVADVVGFLCIVCQALAFLFAFRHTHHDGAEGRAKRQGRDTRQAYGRGNRHTELSEEGARRARHEHHGNEHCHEDQRTRHDGHRHFVHGLTCGFACIADSVLHLCHDSFHHHDGIVHNSTDGQHEGEERQDVEREAGHLYNGKGAQQRHDD